MDVKDIETARGIPCHAFGVSGMIVVEEARSLADLNAAERLQAETWDPSVVVPAEMMLVAAETGGVVVVARDEGRVVGFCMGVAAWDGRTAWMWSHMAAVDPRYQSRGVGAALKFRQREIARARGYRVITWTFDPLEAGNANFNLVKLGAVARVYLPNHYGQMHDRLNRGLPSDRLLAEWWVGGEAAGPEPGEVEDAAPVVFLAARRREDGFAEPATGGAAAPRPETEAEEAAGPGEGAGGAEGGKGAAGAESGEAAAGPLITPVRAPESPLWPAGPWRRGVIEIPLRFQAIKAADMDLARAWRKASAAAFQNAFAMGAVVRSFHRDPAAGVGRYELILGGTKL